MQHYRSIALVPVAVVVICCVRARAREPEQTPLWKIDVRQFGYESFPRRMVRPLRLVVDFTDNAHVAVGWVTPDTTKNNRRKAPKFGEPARLHVLILDTKTGQRQSQKDWLTPYKTNPFVSGIPDGRLLICIDNSLLLLSQTLEVMREQELPDHATCEKVGFHQSPSRRTLLLSPYSEYSSQTELLDVGTFATLSSWTEKPASEISEKTVAISDHWLVGYCGEPRELCLRRFDEPWHPFRSTGLGTRMSDRQRIPVSFVSDEVLAIVRNATTLTTVHGAVLFEIALPKKHSFWQPVPSSGGERFAVIEYRFRGLRSDALDMYPFPSAEQAMVYSVKDRRSNFSIKLRGTSPWSPWHIHDNFLALSPDGTSLAVISDGLLKIYSLPQNSSEQR